MSLTVDKQKKKFNKNSSFSGVESKKSPKSRRKSIATVLPTPLTKKKKEKTVNTDWQVSDNKNETLFVTKNPLIITDPSVELDIKLNTTATPKRKRNTIQSTKTPSKESKFDKNTKKHPSENETSVTTERIDDEKFGIKSTTITKAIQAAIKLHSENPKLENPLFEDRIPLYLQITCHKVTLGPTRILRIPIPNSLLTPDDEICLITPEVKGIKNIEHEKHVEHYEELLRKKGVENIKKIMTFHELRTEYETFEQKSRLVDLYDVFLVDGKISGKVVHRCGKIFYKKRKVPVPVKLQATKLKENISNALSKVFFQLHSKGNCYSVQFGHDKMNTYELVENVYAVLIFLNKEFPGGFENIKNLYVSALKSTSIPIYMSFKNPNEINISKKKSKRPKSYKTYKDELTTLPNANVIVQPSGRVLVKRTLEDESIAKTKTGNADKECSDKIKDETIANKGRKRKNKKTITKTTKDEDVDVPQKKKKSKETVTIELPSDESVQKKKKNLKTRKQEQVEKPTRTKEMKTVAGIVKQKKSKVKK